MKRLLFLLALHLTFAFPGIAWGGLYNPCEGVEGPFPPNWKVPGTEEGFRFVLNQTRTYGNPRPPLDIPGRDNPGRQRYQLVAALYAKSANLDMEQSISLAAYLV